MCQFTEFIEQPATFL